MSVKIKLSINGYGTIGKRVADAFANHPKVEIVGTAKYTPDEDCTLARIKGYKVFVTKDMVELFKKAGREIDGTVDEMVRASDVVIDSSYKFGEENKRLFYEPAGVKAIFQGGEKETIAEVSFNARCNYDEARGKRYIRVVSCNTTGLCRIIKPIAERYQKIDRIDVILIRRGADLSDEKGSALDSVSWKPNSHHAEDVKSIIKNLPIFSIAFKVPHTLMHVHYVKIKFGEAPPTLDELLDIYKKETRIAILRDAKSTANIVDKCRDLMLPRFDSFTVNFHPDTFVASDGTISFVLSVPQESIVIPESVDAVMSQFGLMSRDESMKLTDKLLGIPKIKRELERIFS
ncbi:MAG: type II glyceraldehyde-3-phosphate dehydrogenase [Candidatus Micrarchaeia archaeon]